MAASRTGDLFDAHRRPRREPHVCVPPSRWRAIRRTDRARGERAANGVTALAPWFRGQDVVDTAATTSRLGSERRPSGRLRFPAPRVAVIFAVRACRRIPAFARNRQSTRPHKTASETPRDAAPGAPTASRRRHRRALAPVVAGRGHVLPCRLREGAIQTPGAPSSGCELVPAGRAIS
jgi:hypothetical protein